VNRSQPPLRGKVGTTTAARRRGPLPTQRASSTTKPRRRSQITPVQPTEQ